MAAATITILASATQNATSTGSTPLDVSNNGPIRDVVITTVVNAGCDPELFVWLETAPASIGPWRLLTEVHMDSAQPVGHPYEYAAQKRIPQLDCDSFVRARWRLRHTRNDSGAAPTFTMGIAGKAVVSA